MKFQHALKTTADVLSRNSPTILTGAAVAGMVTTVFLAVSATPEAIRRLDIHREVLPGGHGFGEFDQKPVGRVQVKRIFTADDAAA